MDTGNNKIFSAVDADECKRFVGWRCAFGDTVGDVSVGMFGGALESVMPSDIPRRFRDCDGNEFALCRPLSPPIPQKKWRAFKSVEEWRCRCGLPKLDEIKSFRAKSKNGDIYFLTRISPKDNYSLYFSGIKYSFQELFENFTMLDGTPFGVRE